MGCALSHLRVWNTLLQCQEEGEGGAEWVLVLEDDVELRDGFAAALRQRLQALRDRGLEWDFICVGSRQALDEFVDFDSGVSAVGVGVCVPPPGSLALVRAEACAGSRARCLCAPGPPA